MSQRKIKRNILNRSVFGQIHHQDDLKISWSSSSDEETEERKSTVSLKASKRTSLNTSMTPKPNYKPIPVEITKSNRHNISKTCTQDFTPRNIPKETSFHNILKFEKLSSKNPLNSSMIDDQHVQSLVSKFSMHTVPSPLQIKLPAKLNPKASPSVSLKQSSGNSKENISSTLSSLKPSLAVDKRMSEDDITTPSKRIHLPKTESSPILLYYKNPIKENKLLNTKTADTSPIFKTRNHLEGKVTSPRKSNNRLLRTLQNLNPNDTFAKSLASKCIRVRDRKGQVIEWDQLMGHISKMKPCKSLLPSLSEVSDSNLSNASTSPKFIVTDTTEESESMHIRRKLFTSQEEIKSKSSTSLEGIIELPNTPTQLNTETQNIQMLSQETEKINNEFIIQSTLSETKSTLDIPNISFINSSNSLEIGVRTNENENSNDEKFLDSPKCGKSKKLPPSNTLEGRFVRLLARQRTSYNMWRHEVDSGRVSGSMATRLRVIFAWLEGTKILVDCHPLDPIKGLSSTIKDDRVKKETSKKCVLVLNSEIMGRLPKFQIGSIISIYPPWQCLALPSEQLTFILSVTFIKQDMQLQSTLDLPQEPSWRVLMERSHNSLEQRLPKNGHEFMQPMFSFWSGIPGNQTHSTGYLHSVERNDNSPLLYGSIALVLSNFNQLLFNDNTLHLEIHRIFQYKYSNRENNNPIIYTALIGCDKTGDFCELILGPSNELKYTHPNFINSTQNLGKFFVFDKLQILERTPLKKSINTFSIFESLNINTEKQLLTCLLESSFSTPLSKSQFQDLDEWIRPKSFGLTCQASRVTAVLKVLHSDPLRFYAIEISNPIISRNEDDSINSDNSNTCRNDFVVSSIIYSFEITTACAIEPKRNEILPLQDIMKNEDILFVDKYTSIIFNEHLDEIFHGQYENISTTLQRFTPSPPSLFNEKTTCNDIINVQGVISGIDESTAFSWHFCTLCGDEELEERFGDKFICLNCLIELDDEILGTRMSLEIIVRLQKMKAQLKIKLLQSTIEKLLPPTKISNEGYEIKSILNKPIDLVATVHKVSEKSGYKHYYLEEVLPFME